MVMLDFPVIQQNSVYNFDREKLKVKIKLHKG